ncbi:MAG: Ig-like domain-containing protein [Planctomycetota bacterium]
MARFRRLRWTLLACVGAACSHKASPAAFTITHCSPALGADQPPLLLNDAITVYFSGPVLPVSVTTDSFTLVDEDGRQVPGQLRVGANWITFQPEPPLAPELDDGSYRLGATYHLLVAGSPRADAVRSADGRRLASACSYQVRIARADEKPPDLPAPLRPSASDLPFVLRPSDLQPVAADAPRLQLHFTQPLLPASVVPAAFTVTLLSTRPVELIPRSVRVITSRLDAQPGCSIEIDLGALPRGGPGGAAAALREGEWICVAVGTGATAVRDYAGNPPLPAPVQSWSVVAGNRLALVEWPEAGEAQMPPEDDLLPGFEARGDWLRPAVRVEAGNGSLGVFRPKVDTVLRPGLPFDRGDGEQVVSRDGEFAFQAVDIPAGVRVLVDADAVPVRLLVCGSARIAGVLDVAGRPQPIPARRTTLPIDELAAAVPVALVAAGSIEVTGTILGRTPATDATSGLLLASASSIGIFGTIPFHTLIACESGGDGASPAIRGVRGQSVVFPGVLFTHGLAAGAEFVVRGLTPWRAMPLDRDGGVVQLVDKSAELQVAWQAAPADPVRRTEPDVGIGRVGRLQPVADGDTIVVAAGGFVRFALTAPVRAGRPLPRLRALRVFDR